MHHSNLTVKNYLMNKTCFLKVLHSKPLILEQYFPMKQISLYLIS